MAITGEIERFNVQVHIQKVVIREQQVSRGIASGTEAKRERFVNDIVSLTVSAATPSGAIDKAIRLLEVERGDLGPGTEARPRVETRG